MIKLLLLCCVAGLAGCASPRISRYDEFEKVKVDKMVGNEVNFHLLTRTIVCLNAMREAKWPEPSTNYTIVLTTNHTVTFTTNVTVTSSSSEQVACNTNAMSAPVWLPSESVDTNSETAPVLTTSASGADQSCQGVTLSTSRSQSLARAPHQSVLSQTMQSVTLISGQETISTNGELATAGTNQILTVETNILVTISTNQVVAPSTNFIVTSANQPAFDYYLYTELAPPDFPLSPGESLVVLADGERHVLSPAQPQSGWSTRRGFLTTFYKVPAEVVVQVANASEVKVRIRGNARILERKLSRASLNKIREFLTRCSPPESPPLKLLCPAV